MWSSESWWWMREGMLGDGCSPPLNPTWMWTQAGKTWDGMGWLVWRDTGDLVPSAGCVEFVFVSFQQISPALVIAQIRENPCTAITHRVSILLDKRLRDLYWSEIRVETTTLSWSQSNNGRLDKRRRWTAWIFNNVWQALPQRGDYVTRRTDIKEPERKESMCARGACLCFKCWVRGLITAANASSRNCIPKQTKKNHWLNKPKPFPTYWWSA